MPYVLPAATPAVLEDDALEDAIQDALRGITGLVGNLVRPRWQAEPANWPEFGSNWLAFGVTVFPADKFAFLRMVSDTNVELQCSQELTTLCSFYGPGAMGGAGRLRDGLQIQNNREALALLNIKYVDASNPRQIPSLMKEQWVKRVDLTLRFRRWVVRQYAVNSIEAVNAGLDNEFYITPIIVNPPPTP